MNIFILPGFIWQEQEVYMLWLIRQIEFLSPYFNLLFVLQKQESYEWHSPDSLAAWGLVQFRFHLSYAFMQELKLTLS